MEVVFDCPHCKASIEADSEISGVRAECPACHEIVLVPAPGLELGMELAGFRLEKRLGVGGMGEVFLATQLTMDRAVAIKILPPGMTNDTALVERFIHEVKMSAKLEHPNIVTAFDAGSDGGYYYLAMSFIEGTDLDERLEDSGALPEKEALEICRKVAAALDYAWTKFHMLHRDIKPANIMIDDEGEVKLMDMGIAKTITEDSSLTMKGALVGTPYYMSPEQATANAEMDCRADIYSLGASLYHMVTGARPFDGPNAMTIIAKHLSETPVPPNARNSKVSKGCSNLIERMMARDPNERPASWKTLQDQIDRILKALETGGIPALTGGLALGEDEIGLKSTPAAPGAGNTLAQTMEMAPPAAAETMPAPAIPRPARARGMKGEKLGMAAGAGLGLLIVFLVVGAIVWVFVDAQRRAGDTKLKEKEREIEELRVAGDIEKQIAKIHAGTDSQAAAAQKREALKEMYQLARTYAEKHPEDPQGARAKFATVLKYAKGTKYELMIEDDLAKLQKKSTSDKETVMRRLRDRAEKLAGAYCQFAPAAHLLASYKGSCARETRAARNKLATEYAKRAEDLEPVAELLKTMVPSLLAGDYAKVETALRNARKSQRFKKTVKLLEENVQLLGKIKRLDQKYSKKKILRLNNKERHIAILKALMAWRNRQPETARKYLPKSDGCLLAQVLLGESYARQLPGQWHSVAFSGDKYHGQIKSLKLKLNKDGRFQTSINDKKAITGKYSIHGAWLYLSHGRGRREYWQIRSFKGDRLRLAPKTQVYVTLARHGGSM